MDIQQHADAVQMAPQPLRFHASGGEYFRIWIVNLLLTIVTLGIYSAWAKVRRNQYFYSSTELAGSSFEYHGNPIAILKGRVAALLLFGGYNIAMRYSPVGGACMALLLMAVLPWLSWKSMQFKLYNTSYRGVRFGFKGSARQAYFYELLLPVLSVLTVGLLAPYTHQRLKQYQHSESRYGGSYFAFDGRVGGFYKAYGIFAALYFGGMIVFGTALVFVLKAVPGGPGNFAHAPAVIALFAIIYLWAFIVLPLFLTLIQNLIWNHTSLGGHRFASTLTWGRTSFIMLTNLLGVAVTLGLFMPFAHVRWLKYRLESTALLAAGGLDDFVAGAEQSVGGFGEGAMDMLDFDLSL
ncbi:YjgN family protein [Rugamonas sp.]|uniref:YjgN family protein n=1 Tax=Rugamonas sp. TaxID=1926287 RepID=UPI0025E712F8|nr:YjgN family protein [Rugamonas sp.]